MRLVFSFCESDPTEAIKLGQPVSNPGKKDAKKTTRKGQPASESSGLGLGLAFGHELALGIRPRVSGLGSRVSGSGAPPCATHSMEFIYPTSSSRSRPWGSSQSMAGPTGTIPWGFSPRWLS